MEPLVSILIPAYNSSRWIKATLESAKRQTWKRKEIIVVDDGSTDDTLAIAREFQDSTTQVVTKPNAGAAEARNTAQSLAQGDFIQWLDADDLLSPSKIERQLELIDFSPTTEYLLSCPWIPFYSRPCPTSTTATPLWRDLQPVDWLVLKFSNNLHQQTATWLTPRCIFNQAGPWDNRLLSDDDGEYFTRALLHSKGTKFTRDSLVYYRITPTARLSHIGDSSRKLEAMHLSMKLNISYLRNTEDSPRVRHACLVYLQTWLHHFHPRRPDLANSMSEIAQEIGGCLVNPTLPRKYRILAKIVGQEATRSIRQAYNHHKSRILARLDSMVSHMQGSSSLCPKDPLPRKSDLVR